MKKLLLTVALFLMLLGMASCEEITLDEKEKLLNDLTNLNLDTSEIKELHFTYRDEMDSEPKIDYASKEIYYSEEQGIYIKTTYAFLVEENPIKVASSETIYCLSKAETGEVTVDAYEQKIQNYLENPWKKIDFTMDEYNDYVNHFIKTLYQSVKVPASVEEIISGYEGKVEFSYMTPGNFEIVYKVNYKDNRVTAVESKDRLTTTTMKFEYETDTTKIQVPTEFLPPTE